ncbi:N-acetylglutamate synthase [Polychaeton citri CBS 116435]|uniref:Amino-acid acetyltransferase, mitochondrial n=1 Tax=Polychaeton citri CBS 116435 TaxID=1314669 RepID=A0A9P4Q341_9PEZI|nr:N-acetylglutamate synthase [Polychaeton citri CBS 116435]
MYSSGKACAPGNLGSIQRAVHSTSHRLYSTSLANVNGNGKPKPNDVAAQRQLMLDVLEANATRRDAKQYLARFKPPKAELPPLSEASKLQQQRNERSRKEQDRLDRIGVNLGGLYAPARAIAQSPQFTRQEVDERAVSGTDVELHVALVLFRTPQLCDSNTLDGVAQTLSQLVKLDMAIAIVLDIGLTDGDAQLVRAKTAVQADRVRVALEKHNLDGARLITGALELPDYGELHADSPHSVEVALPDLIKTPLLRGITPIVPALAYTPTGQLTQVAAEAVMRALTRLFSTLPCNVRTDHKRESLSPAVTSLDRIIVLDPAGGIPSKDRGDGSHVFVNLSQEYNEIFQGLIVDTQQYPGSPKSHKVYTQHARNLQVTQECLSMLPGSSSALVITPEEAASSSQVSVGDESDLVGTRTRKQKNTLIHNLLTNKPMVSSSLPAARMAQTDEDGHIQATSRVPGATLLKLGMPLTFVPPASRATGWLPPSRGLTSLDLEHDDKVDFPRLLHLIEDSFRRKLDVRHYLHRITGSIAGLIVAGNYEGGAILTWETPTSLRHLSPEHPERARRLVPYLDKFAVLQSSQGSAGVADIVFQSMVRTCFPYGVCWRSRKDNPVNKWYFERSAGTWQIPNTNWTMFWTGEGVVDDEVRFRDYVEVCRDVQPSWADSKKPD